MIAAREVIDTARLSGPVKFGATVRAASTRTPTRRRPTRSSARPRPTSRQGLLNMKSPLARALIGKEPGDSVEVRTPGRPALLRDPGRSTFV